MQCQNCKISFNDKINTGFQKEKHCSTCRARLFWQFAIRAAENAKKKQPSKDEWRGEYGKQWKKNKKHASPSVFSKEEQDLR